MLDSNEKSEILRSIIQERNEASEEKPKVKVGENIAKVINKPITEKFKGIINKVKK